MFVPNLLTGEEISIVPSHGKQPTSILSDTFCEQLAFPCLFPQGKFGYNIERDVKLNPIKYFNQRLLNYTQMFASNPDYIFYALSVTQQQKLNSHINVASRKVCSGRMA